jgi:hypothetical protein
LTAAKPVPNSPGVPLFEAAADAEIAARTGGALYLTTEAFHRLNLSDADYETIAEELLLKSAAFDFPNPQDSPCSGRSINGRK